MKRLAFRGNDKKKGRGLTKTQKVEATKIVDRRLKVASEVKYYDYASSINLINQWAWAQIVLPTQGTGDQDQRDGDMMLPFRMEIRAGLTGPTSTTTNSISRIVIFRVKTGQSANTYFSIGSGSASAYAVYSPYSKDRRKAIEVLYDKTFAQVQGSNSHEIAIVKNLKLARKPIGFIGASTTYEINGLYLAVCSDQATNNPTMTCNIRTYYTDS